LRVTGVRAEGFEVKTEEQEGGELRAERGEVKGVCDEDGDDEDDNDDDDDGNDEEERYAKLKCGTKDFTFTDSGENE
jgi:hypothetical protein